MKRPALSRERIVDTLILARRRHPAGPNRLEDLCTRYGIDHSRRTKHGALLDAELLAEVYAELIGGRQARLGFGETVAVVERRDMAVTRIRPVALSGFLDPEQEAAHRVFVASLGEAAIWRDYVSVSEIEAGKS
jgi:DNA polymerase-3 subunit epsilon